MADPFNTLIHQHLLDAGFEFNHVEADWYDPGDPEVGPYLTGHPAYQEYTDATHRVYVEDTGRVLEVEERNIPREEYEARITAADNIDELRDDRDERARLAREDW